MSRLAAFTVLHGKRAPRVAAVAMAMLAVPLVSSAQTSIYSDNGNNGYTSSWVGQNGGTGFSAWTNIQGTTQSYLAGGFPGGGDNAWAMFASSGWAVLRPLNDGGARSAVGTLQIVARHNVNNSGAFTGFNVKKGAGSGFGSDAFELLSFGLTPGTGNNSIFVSGASPITGFGELRGATITYTLDFNTIERTYTLSVTAGSVTGSRTGTLGNIGVSEFTALVTRFGAGHFNSGGSQDLLFNNLSLTVREPAQRRATLPGSGTSRGSITSTGAITQTSTFASTPNGYLQLTGLSASTSPTVAIALNDDSAAGKDKVVALIQSRLAVVGNNIASISLTAPSWVALLPGGGSQYDVFITLAAAAGSDPYFYWDFAALSGQGVVQVAIPEPSGAALLLLTAGALLRRRSKAVKAVKSHCS